MMFFVQYPKSKTGFTWKELGCLARSLGFHQDCLKTSLPDDIKNDPQRTGLTLKELDKMIACKYYLVCLDQTFNVHSDDWNIRVLQKASRLVCARFISFPGLMDVRVAYQLYEGRDTKGMKTDERTISRCFKMCDRAIAPMKLRHRLKHLRPSLEVKDRIQLHEFLDLILWSKHQSPQRVVYPETSSQTERQLFKMTDFDGLFEHHDLKLANSLNRLYLREEWNFSLPVGGAREKEKLEDGTMVDNKTRFNQAKINRIDSARLRPVLRTSEREVQLLETGHYLKGRPQSAPELGCSGDGGTRSMTSLESRPVSEGATLLQTYMPELLKSTRGEPPEPFVPTNYRPPSSAYSRTHTPVTVHDGDRLKTESELSEVIFDLNVCNERYQHRAQRDLEYLRPGILERLSRRPKSSPPAPKPEKKVRAPRPDPEHLIKLSQSPRREPSPCHRRVCDIRFKDRTRIFRPASSRA